MTAKGPYLMGYEEARHAMEQFLAAFHASLVDEVLDALPRAVAATTVKQLVYARKRQEACRGAICYLKDAAAQLQITL